MIENQETRNFFDIARCWKEEWWKKCPDSEASEEDFCRLLVDSALREGFEFLVRPKGDAPLEYMSSLYSTADAHNQLTTTTLYEYLYKALLDKNLIEVTSHKSNENLRDLLEGASSRNAIAAEIAKSVYVSRDNFHRWCRVQFEKIRVREEFCDFELSQPTFWGDVLTNALDDRFSLAESGKHYSLLETPKYFLDPELWDEYCRWAEKPRASENNRIRPLHWNWYIEAQEKLEQYLKDGKLVLEAYHYPRESQNVKEIFSSDVVKGISFDFARNRMKLDNQRYVDAVVLIPVKAKKKKSRKPKKEHLPEANAFARKKLAEWHLEGKLKKSDGSPILLKGLHPDLEQAFKRDPISKGGTIKFMSEGHFMKKFKKVENEKHPEYGIVRKRKAKPTDRKSHKKTD